MPMAPHGSVEPDLQRSVALQAGMQLIAMAAKALLVLGGAVLLGEVVTGPGRRLIRHGQRPEDAGETGRESC
ncbi:MAG: hypothetical protein RLZZ624_88 [Cyanobacteriota bacterium]